MLGIDLSLPGLFLSTGRETKTISQILADQKLRKQNEYVEVKAWGCRTVPMVLALQGLGEGPDALGGGGGGGNSSPR